MRVFLFNHSGSLNRGCEAIIRGTVNVLDTALTGCEYNLSSYAPEEDALLADIVRVEPFRPNTLTRAEHLAAALKIRLLRDESYSVLKGYSAFLDSARGADLCLSVGGDSYCYGDNAVIRILTEKLKRMGKKTVLWGASVGEEDLTPEKEKNLGCFDAVFTREPLTYDLLKRKALNSRVYLFPDPAFTLGKEKLPLPEGWKENNTVGLNISSIVCSRNPSLMEAAAGFIKSILADSDMAVALIPHVTASNNDDMPALKALYKLCSNNADGRLFLLPGNLNALEYKGYISRLRFFVGARTHATIAAYTSCVPTIVLGYSVKSRGISFDLFGDEEYVLDSGKINSATQLIKAFEALRADEEKIKHTLRSVIPGKIRSAYEAGTALFKTEGQP